MSSRSPEREVGRYLSARVRDMHKEDKKRKGREEIPGADVSLKLKRSDGAVLGEELSGERKLWENSMCTPSVPSITQEMFEEIIPAVLA